MYRIMSKGQIVALVDEPRYVRCKASTGAWIQCDSDEAEALAVAGTLFSLTGKVAIPDTDVATVMQVDGSEYVFNNYVDNIRYDVSMESIETALCELEMQEDEDIAAIETALCELDTEE